MATSRPSADHFTILYFAAANTFTKKKSESFPGPLQLSNLYDTLEKKYPGIKEKVLSSCALTVNLEYVDLEDADESAVIKPGDEVAIIPPALQNLLTAFNAELDRQNASYYAELDALHRDTETNQEELARLRKAQESLGESLQENTRARATTATNNPLGPANLPAPVVQLAALVLFAAMLWDSILLIAGLIAYVERVLLYLLGFDTSYAFGHDFWSQWAIVAPVVCYVLYYQTVYLHIAFRWITALHGWMTPRSQPSSCLTCQPLHETPGDKEVENGQAKTLKPLGIWKRSLLQALLALIVSTSVSWIILSVDFRLTTLSRSGAGLGYMYAGYISQPLGLTISTDTATVHCFFVISFVNAVIAHAVVRLYLLAPLLEYIGYDSSWYRTDENEQMPPAHREFDIPPVTNDS